MCFRRVKISWSEQWEDLGWSSFQMLQSQGGSNSWNAWWKWKQMDTSRLNMVESAVLEMFFFEVAVRRDVHRGCCLDWAGLVLARGTEFFESGCTKVEGGLSRFNLPLCGPESVLEITIGVVRGKPPLDSGRCGPVQSVGVIFAALKEGPCAEHREATFLCLKSPHVFFEVFVKNRTGKRFSCLQQRIPTIVFRQTSFGEIHPPFPGGLKL